MNENDKSRSGLQTAVDFAHAARAAKRIMQAAAHPVCMEPQLPRPEKRFHFS